MHRYVFTATLALSAGLLMAVQANSNQERRGFRMTIPSGLEIEAKQVGVGFYEARQDSPDARIYQIFALFRSTAYGDQPRESNEHYGLNTTAIDFKDPKAAKLLNDMKVICLATHSAVRDAIPRFVLALDAEAINNIADHPASFYRVVVEYGPIRKTEVDDGIELDAIEITHDLRDGSCDAIAREDLPKVPTVSR